MCRLFGLYANKDVDAEFSLWGPEQPAGDDNLVRSFRKSGDANPDGWGGRVV